MDAFHRPDFTAPLDLEERCAAAPRVPMVKGMFLQQVVDLAAARGVSVGTTKYAQFRDYRVQEFLRLIAEAATKAFPDMEPARAVYELARPTFTRVRDSLIGRVIFTVTDFEGSLKLASAAYRRFGIARMSLAEFRPGYAVVELRNVWDFPTWSAGVYQGALEAFKLTGEVRIRRPAQDALDIQVTWHR